MLAKDLTAVKRYLRAFSCWALVLRESVSAICNSSTYNDGIRIDLGREGGELSGVSFALGAGGRGRDTFGLFAGEEASHMCLDAGDAVLLEAELSDSLSHQRASDQCL